MESPYDLHMNDPFSKYSLDEIKQMSEEDFASLMEESNRYVHEKHRILQESNHEVPKFNTIEELRAYYHCRPLDEAINSFNLNSYL